MKSSLSYKREKPEGKWDAIVIGSGIGGLCCAALLSKEGKRVLVLEKHYVSGGFTHVFKRPGYEWDIGFHYMGEVHREESFSRRLFDYITDNELKWADMGEVYDRIIFPDQTYDFVTGVKNWKEQIKGHFPKEAAAIDKYVDMIHESTQAARSYFSERALPQLVSSIAGPIMKRKFYKYSDRTTLDVLQSITSDKKLIGVLTGQYGDYGLPPAQSSFAMHAMVVKHYFNGGAYPIGGSSRMADTIYPVIKQGGGEVYVNAGVKSILTKGNKAYGVKMEDGNEILADIIISNAGIANTYAGLLKGEISEKFKLEAKLGQTKPSASHVCLYVGMKESSKDLALERANLWIYPGYDHDKNIADYLENHHKPLPVTYVSFPSAKDPSWEDRYPGTSTIEVIGLAPYEWFAEWEDKRWKKRGDEYEKYKEEFAQRLLSQLYTHVPQIQGKIDHYELSSPLSTRNFTSYQLGEIYGIEHTPERFRLKFLRAESPVKNLYLTGQDIVTAGIGGALGGGLLTASAILKRNLISQITARKEKV